MFETQSINGLKLKLWRFEMGRLTFTIMDGEQDGMNGLNLILIESNVFEVKLFKMQSVLTYRLFQLFHPTHLIMCSFLMKTQYNKHLKRFQELWKLDERWLISWFQWNLFTENEWRNKESHCIKKQCYVIRIDKVLKSITSFKLSSKSSFLLKKRRKLRKVMKRSSSQSMTWFSKTHFSCKRLMFYPHRFHQCLTDLDELWLIILLIWFKKSMSLMKTWFSFLHET